MALKLKIIKQSEFTANETKHKHYTCAYRGRLFGISTRRWEGSKDALVAKDKVLTINAGVEVLKNPSYDPLTGVTKTFLDIVPASGLNLAEF